MPEDGTAEGQGTPVEPLLELARLLPDVGYVAEIDPHLRFRYVSPSVEAVIGYTPEDLYAQPHAGLDLLDSRDSHAITLVQSAQPGAIVEFTARWHAKDGRTVWTHHRCHAESEPGGVIVLYGLAREVTDEHDAVEALAAAEEQARLVLDYATDVLIRYAPDGTVLWASPSLRTTFGYDPDAVVGTKLRIGVPEDQEQMTRLTMAAVVEHRDTARVRMRIVCADGSRRWGDVVSRYVWGADGAISFAVSTLHDVTAQVEAELALAESERQYRLLAENASDVVFRGSPDATMEWVSTSVTDLLGWAPAEMVGQRAAEFLHPDDRIRLLEASRRVNEGGPGRYEARFRTSAGSYRWLQVTARPIRDVDGVIIGRVGSWRDVQAEVEAREALARSERRFRLAMESAPTGMAVVDLDRRFVEVNPALCQMLGREADWLLTHRVPDVVHPDDDGLDLRMRADVISGRVTATTGEKRLVRADGEVLWVQHAVGLLRDERGHPLSYVSQFVNVSEAHTAREALSFLATHDPLTELVNRRELLRRLGRYQSQRPRSGDLLGILYLDLDDFKPVNDTYGHAIGDALLIDVARRIKAQVRAADYVARQGGDEFVVVLPSISARQDATAIADKILLALVEPFDLEGHRVTVTASIGIAVAEHGDDPDYTLRHADVALMRAKRSGRSRAVAYDPAIDDPELAHYRI